MKANRIVLLAFTFPAILTAQINPAREMLATALRSGDLGAPQSLLSSGVDPDQPDRYGDTALSVALLYRNERPVDLLLARHADPNVPLKRNNQQSMVPLQFVAREGDPWIAQSFARGGRTNR